jgi:hypothetical protein
MLAYQFRGVYAMPVVVAGAYVGALDLFRTHPAELESTQVAGMVIAAELAQYRCWICLMRICRQRSPTPAATPGRS